LRGVVTEKIDAIVLRRTVQKFFLRTRRVVEVDGGHIKHELINVKFSGGHVEHVG
jgi:hypothetical protein